MSTDSVTIDVVRDSLDGGSTIVHRWFHNGRPFNDIKSFEYLLPIRNLALEHSQVMCDWMKGFADLDPATASTRFKNYLTDSGQQNEITELLFLLTPFSVLFHGGECWLLCKTSAELSNPSAHGNMVLVPPPTLSPTWPVGWDAPAFDPLKKLLAHFGGMRFELPPVFPDLFRPVELRQETATAEYGDFYNLRSWLGSHVVYNINNVDRVLVDSDCRFGRMDEEYQSRDFVNERTNSPWMHDHDNGSVFLIGQFNDFVKFLVSQAGITTPAAGR